MISVTGSTYAYLTSKASSNNSLTGTGYCNDLNYTSQEINSDELLSTVNYLEGVTTTVKLSYNASCTIYKSASINIHTNTTTTSPITRVHALRYKVLNGSTLISEGIVTQTGDVVLATVPLTTTETTYNVYLWIDSNVSQGEYDATTYSGYIFARSEQTSTITQ